MKRGKLLMKLRTTFCFLITLFFVSTVNITTTLAQDSPQWHLPDGVSARLGKGIIQEIACSPDGSRLAVGSGIGIWIYNAFTGAELALIGGHTGYAAAIAFSPDGDTLASGSADDTVRLWDVETGTLINTLTGHTGWVKSVAYSPDGNTLITGGSNDRTVRLWDTNTGTLQNTLTGHTGAVISVAFSPDGNTIVSGSNDRTARLWDANTGTLKNILRHTDWVYSVAFSPDGNTLASGGYDGTVRLWDTNTGTLQNTLTGHTNAVDSVAFSPDGNTLATGSWDRTVRLWDANTGTLQNTLTGHTERVLSVAFSPDGNTLATGGWREGGLWNANTGTLQNTLTGHTERVLSVAFSPDGNTLATGGGDGTVLLWRLTPTSATITFNPNSVPDQTFAVGTPVSLTLPIATGGTPLYTYTLSAIPIGLAFDSTTRQINGTPTTPGTTETTYTVTDTTGASASLTFTITIEVNLDVNADGKVDVLDLVWVAISYGMRGDVLRADVNADGVVNVQDLVAVAEEIDAADVLPAKVAEEVALAAEAAAAFEGVAGAPGMAFSSRSAVVSGATAHRNVAAALTDARSLVTDDVRLGKWMPLLEGLLQTLAEMKTIPQTTALLPNYPNPFNPETWIPYQLSEPAAVRLTIYDIQGHIVRDLDLGHQRAGMYQSRSRAAYWDGKNAQGESVASGVYFYTLSTESTRDSVTVGDFTATRKLLIRK
ncbi:hypothetical protein C6499_10515 [Candidatus Poribacteria bacterium]|nr:MAG: hypothetical protein C6499_10515 [Candidatus Poribacteria bacterium]